MPTSIDFYPKARPHCAAVQQSRVTAISAGRFAAVRIIACCKYNSLLQIRSGDIGKIPIGWSRMAAQPTWCGKSSIPEGDAVPQLD